MKRTTYRFPHMLVPIFLLSTFAPAQRPNVDGVLKVAMLRPVSTLHPYYDRGIEGESVTALLFDQPFRVRQGQISPDLLDFADKDEPGVLKRRLEFVNRHIRWDSLDRNVSRLDLLYSFHLLRMNPWAQHINIDGFLHNLWPDERSENDLHLSLIAEMHPPRELRHLMTFEVLPWEVGCHQVVMFDKKREKFFTSKNQREARGWLKQHLESKGKSLYLTIGDIAVKSNHFEGGIQLMMSKDFDKPYRNPSLALPVSGLNLADVAFTFFVWVDLMKSMGENLPQPLPRAISHILVSGQEGRLATLVPRQGRMIDEDVLQRLFHLPLLFRFPFEHNEVRGDPYPFYPYDLSAKSNQPVFSQDTAKNYWRTPDCSYKFRVNTHEPGRLLLGRGRSRDPARDRSQYAVREIAMENLSANSLEDLTSGFSSGNTHMVLIERPFMRNFSNERALAKRTTGTHVEMFALNNRSKIVLDPGGNKQFNPLADVRVRRALSRAVNRKTLRRDYRPRDAALMVGPLTSTDVRTSKSSTAQGGQPLDSNSFSQEHAIVAREMRKAGYQKTAGKWQRSGKPLPLRIIYEKELDTRNRGLAYELRVQLEAGGFECEDVLNTSLEPEAFRSALFSGEGWHIALVQVYQGRSADMSRYNPRRQSRNFLGYRPEPTRRDRIEELFDNYELARGDQLTEVKNELALLIALDAPAIWLWDFQNHYLINSNRVETPAFPPSTFDVLEGIDDFKLLGARQSSGSGQRWR